MAMDLNEQTMRRIHKLRAPDSEGRRLQVEAIWECQIHEQCRRDPALKEFMDDLANEKGPIDPVCAYSTVIFSFFYSAPGIYWGPLWASSSVCSSITKPKNFHV
jgi:hypothetical protein